MAHSFARLCACFRATDSIIELDPMLETMPLNKRMEVKRHASWTNKESVDFTPNPNRRHTRGRRGSRPKLELSDIDQRVLIENERRRTLKLRDLDRDYHQQQRNYRERGLRTKKKLAVEERARFARRARLLSTDVPLQTEKGVVYTKRRQEASKKERKIIQEITGSGGKAPRRKDRTVNNNKAVRGNVYMRYARTSKVLSSDLYNMFILSVPPTPNTQKEVKAQKKLMALVEELKGEITIDNKTPGLKTIQTLLLRAGIEPNPGPAKKLKVRKYRHHDEKARQQKEDVINLAKMKNVPVKVAQDAVDMGLIDIEESYATVPENPTAPAPSQVAPPVEHPEEDDTVPTIKIKPDHLNEVAIHPRRMLLDGIHPSPKQILSGFAAFEKMVEIEYVGYTYHNMKQEVRVSTNRPIPSIKQSLIVGVVRYREQQHTGIKILDKVLYAMRQAAFIGLKQTAVGPRTFYRTPIKAITHSICSMFKWVTDHFYETQAPIHFVPHMLTETVQESPLKTDVKTMMLNSRQRATRLTSLPVPDHMQDTVLTGNDILAAGVVTDRLNLLTPAGEQARDRCDPLAYTDALSVQVQHQLIQDQRCMQSGTGRLMLDFHNPTLLKLTKDQLYFLMSLLVVAVLVIIGALILGSSPVMPLFRLIVMILKLSVGVLRNVCYVTTLLLTPQNYLNLANSAISSLKIISRRSQSLLTGASALVSGWIKRLIP